jgi:hypothetical protein
VRFPALVLAAAAALAIAGCGGPSADLFVVQRTGSVPGANLKMLVSDGSVRCNGGREIEITSRQLLLGRAIATDLEDVHQSDIPAVKPVIFGFTVRSESGTLRFADVVQRPRVLPRLVRLVRDLARRACGLSR